MINTKLAYIEPKSISLISTVMTLIGSIIGLVISLIATVLIVTSLPQLKSYVFNGNILTIVFGIIIGLIILLAFNYILTYVYALIYNYLLNYFTGVQFELTPHNEIKEIDILPTLSMFIILISILLIITGIILFFTFSIALSALSHATSLLGNIDISTITASSLTAVTLIVLLSILLIGIAMLIYLFIFNFFARRNPLKVEIAENNGLELKSIDVVSYVMSIGLTLLTVQLIRTLMNIMIGGSMEVALLNIINTVSICIVFSVAIPFIYNIVASKVGGLKFDIEPSSNMVQEYSLTKNANEHEVQ